MTDLVTAPTTTSAPTSTAPVAQIDSNSIAARISTEAHALIENKMHEWFGNTSELGAYDADSVRELGRNVI